MAAKSARVAIPKPHLPQADGETGTLAEGWERYHTATITGAVRKLPGMMRLIQAAYLAGAGEAVLQIGEAKDRDARIHELSRECESSFAEVVTPR